MRLGCDAKTAVQTLTDLSMMKADVSLPRPISITSDKAAMWSLLALAVLVHVLFGQAIRILSTQWNVRQVWTLMGACAAFLIVGAYRNSVPLETVFGWRGTSVGWFSLSAGIGGFMALLVRTQLASLRPVAPDTLVLSTTMGPLLEELLFRGFMWSVLSSFFVGQVRGRAGIVIVACCCATIFALFHVNPSIGYFWLRFAAGLVLGGLRASSDSSLPPAAAHLAFNICVVS